MNEVIARNRSGWILHEYINIPEEQISEYQNVTGSYAVVKVGNKYLVGYNDWRKQWEFPAGGIEDGETARQAALRELFEETHQGNLNLEFKGLFKVTDSHGKQKYQAVYLGQKEALEPFVYSENDEMSKIRLWDMTEDIGYVDELDVAIVKMVDTEAQKEFMRYAFLKEPKTPLGKLVAGAWRRFKEWWDENKRNAVEERTRKSVLADLEDLKKEVAKQPRKPIIPKKHRGPELE